MKRTKFGKRILWIGLIVLALVGGGGYAAYAYWLAPQQATQQESTLQTATVTVGDLSITADGTGVLVPSTQVDLAFSTDGTVEELSVEVGDKVQAGDVLASIDDTDARKAVADAELGAVQAEAALEDARDTASLEQAVAQAEFQVAQAEANLETAQSDLDELLNWTADETEVEIAKADLVIAQASYQNTVAKAEMSDESLAPTRINLGDAVRSLEEAQVSYANAMDAARDWEKNIESTRQNAAKALQKAQDSLEVAQANYDLAQLDTSTIDIQSAWVKVLNAKTALEDLQTPPDEQEIAAARIAMQEQELALQQAKLDRADAEKALAEVDTTEAELALQQARLNLEAAQRALDGTTLRAPISGTVLEVNAVAGESVSGTAIVLADLDTPLIEFWVEESDLDSVVVGNTVHIAFEALPDVTYEGQIARVDPALTTVSNTAAVQAWASIDIAANPVQLLSNMNVEVEVVAGEAKNALLVPVTALREVGDGQYAVFVVHADGSLEMRSVEVGLMDYVNAEIRSGVQGGELVSTGTTTTSSQTSTTTNPTQSNDAGPMGMPGDGGMIPPMGG
jgi:HlyD family secretion protein